MLLPTSRRKQTLRIARTPLKLTCSIIRVNLGTGGLRDPKNRQRSPKQPDEDVKFEALEIERAIRPKDAHHHSNTSHRVGCRQARQSTTIDAIRWSYTNGPPRNNCYTTRLWLLTIRTWKISFRPQHARNGTMSAIIMESHHHAEAMSCHGVRLPGSWSC